MKECCILYEVYCILYIVLDICNLSTTTVCGVNWLMVEGI